MKQLYTTRRTSPTRTSTSYSSRRPREYPMAPRLLTVPAEGAFAVAHGVLGGRHKGAMGGGAWARWHSRGGAGRLSGVARACVEGRVVSVNRAAVRVDVVSRGRE